MLADDLLRGEAGDPGNRGAGPDVTTLFIDDDDDIFGVFDQRFEALVRRLHCALAAQTDLAEPENQNERTGQHARAHNIGTTPR